MDRPKKEKKQKEKRRSNEKRKEKSRDAARYRRGKEADIFAELAAVLPVPQEQANNLDKASVMRLAIAYLKVRCIVDSIPSPLAKSETSNQMDKLFTKALNGFMLVLSNDGNIVYLTDNVSDFLGVSQMDMMGQSVYEYSHPCDHDELRECLSTKATEDTEKRACSFFLRLKCTLTSKGRKVNLKSASYKVIHCTGRLTYTRHLAPSSSDTEDEEQKTEDEEINRASLVLLGCPIPHPSNLEVPLGHHSHTFLSKHSLSMKFTYADEKLTEYLGWNSEELMGQSVFEYYHACDYLALDKAFKSLFSKGQCETVAYRFLGKLGGYAWVVTQATLIHCSKQQKPLSVVCVNYVISGVENEDEVYSLRQHEARNTKISEKVKSEEEPLRAKDVVPSPLKTKLKLQIQVQVNKLEENAFNGKELPSKCSLVQPSELTTGGAYEHARPALASTDRRLAEKPKKKSDQLQDGSRKDNNTFPRPVQPEEKSFNCEEATKESLEQSVKENSEPKQPKVAPARPPFIFQGKPAVINQRTNKYKPQVVTKQLFSSIAPQQQEEEITCRPPPQTATATIFAPRTEDMNKGYLTFSEDHPGLTMLKDEPEDLTHLAPTPGDVCVPLDETPFITEMLDEFILGTDNYCSLMSPCCTLAPELRSTDFNDPLKDTELMDTSRNKGLDETLADSDPFMYGDSPSSPCSIDPSTVSPPLTKYPRSPERSMDSLGSPTGGSGAEGLSEDEMLMLGLNDSITDDDLLMRAPYIPTDQDEALDLLTSNDMVMWSPLQTTDQKNCLKWLAEKEQRTTDSSLAQLLKTDQVVSRKYNDHGGGLVNPMQVLGQIPRKNTNLDNCHWSSKLDRPTKRIHTASIDTENDNKRIKCEELKRNSYLSQEDHLLSKQQSSPDRKSSNLNSSSQLLRRLVSQQNVLKDNNFANESLEDAIVSVDNRLSKGGQLRQTEVDTDQDEGDGGGGDEDVKCRRALVTENGDVRNSQRNPACNSVLMNLLVSGCDVNLMDSRNVPSIYSKDLTSPLSVNLDNHQMVPQCPDSGGSNSSFNQLSPIAKKQLSNMLTNASIASPSSPIVSFENLEEYDPSMSGNGYFQVDQDLFGTLLDRSFV